MISIVIPVFNRPEAVERAISSVRDQRGLNQDIEIIVVDDASDPPLRLVTDSDIRVLRLEKNLGPAAARNAAIEASSGSYLAFLDSDDIWLRDKLKGQIEFLNSLGTENEGLIGIACGFYYPNRFSNQLEARIPRAGLELLDFVGGCWHSPGSTLFIDRSVFNVVGPFDARLRRFEDLDWFIRFGLCGGRLLISPSVGVIVAPSHEASIRTVKQSAGILEEKFNQTGEIPLDYRYYRYLRAYLELERGVTSLAVGRRLVASGHLLKSFMLRPRMQTSIERYASRSRDIPTEITAAYGQTTTK